MAIIMVERSASIALKRFPREDHSVMIVVGKALSPRVNQFQSCIHHWIVTTVVNQEEKTVFYHHECVKCKAQKDVPIFIKAEPWIKSGHKATPSIID